MLDVYLHLLTQAQRRRALLGDPSWSGASQEALREQIAKQEAKTRAALASEMAAQSASSSTVPNSYRGASRSGRGHPSARPAHRGNGIRGGRVVAAVTVFRELPLRVLHQIVLLFPPLHVDTIFCPLRSLVQAQVRSNVFSMQHCLLDSDTRATTPSSTSANARTRAGSSIPVRGQASR